MTTIDKILRKIKRRKKYKSMPSVASAIDEYIKKHNMSRKGADERLEAFYDKLTKTKTKKEKKEPQYKMPSTTPTRGDRAGETYRIKIDTELYKNIKELETKANRMAKSAGLDYEYSNLFASKEGAMRYYEHLLKVTQTGYFDELAQRKLDTFIDTTRRMFEIYKNTTDDGELKQKYQEVIDKLKNKTTDFNKIYNNLKSKYDTSELSVYLFSSDVDMFELQSDSELINIINSILDS